MACAGPAPGGGCGDDTGCSVAAWLHGLWLQWEPGKACSSDLVLKLETGGDLRAVAKWTYCHSHASHPDPQLLSLPRCGQW